MGAVMMEQEGGTQKKQALFAVLRAYPYSATSNAENMKSSLCLRHFHDDATLEQSILRETYWQ